MSKESERDELIAASYWLQAVGAYITAVGHTKLLSKSKEQREEGENLIEIGNVLQAIAVLFLSLIPFSI